MVDVKPTLPLFDGSNVRAYLAQFSIVLAYLVAVDAAWNNEQRDNPCPRCNKIGHPADVCHSAAGRKGRGA